MRSRLAARRRGLQRPTLSSWTCFRAPLRSSRWIAPTSPASLELRNSMSGSLAAQIPSLNGGSCHFSVICIKRSPDPGSSLFPPALLTRRPLTSPTLWVLWSRVTPPCRWLRTLWPTIFHPLWRIPGSPAPSFLSSFNTFVLSVCDNIYVYCPVSFVVGCCVCLWWYASKAVFLLLLFILIFRQLNKTGQL